MRSAKAMRKTKETDIAVTIGIDGSGIYEGTTGVPFFDHMMTLFTKHGFMDLSIQCTGDVDVDDHHSIEDIGITLGEAFLSALDGKKGISRYATQFLPMDEALAMVSIDLSGRPFFVYDVEFQAPTTGNFDACLMEEFLRAFAFAAGITMHVKLLYGSNTHHILEAVIKGVARALDAATRIDDRVKGVLSTKGVL